MVRVAACVPPYVLLKLLISISCTSSSFNFSLNVAQIFSLVVTSSRSLCYIITIGPLTRTLAYSSREASMLFWRSPWSLFFFDNSKSGPPFCIRLIRVILSLSYRCRIRLYIHVECQHRTCNSSRFHFRVILSASSRSFLVLTSVQLGIRSLWLSAGFTPSLTNVCLSVTPTFLTNGYTDCQEIWWQSGNDERPLMQKVTFF